MFCNFGFRWTVAISSYILYKVLNQKRAPRLSRMALWRHLIIHGDKNQFQTSIRAFFPFYSVNVNTKYRNALLFNLMVTSSHGNGNTVKLSVLHDTCCMEWHTIEPIHSICIYVSMHKLKCTDAQTNMYKYQDLKQPNLACHSFKL